MAENLYPLTYKPGIKRDGTTFQADYCTSGQWIRFQRGYIKKMGGMKGVTIGNVASQIVTPRSVFMLPAADNNIKVYVTGEATEGGAQFIDSYVINQNFDLLVNTPVNLGRMNVSDAVWQYEFIIQGGTNIVVYLVSSNSRDINSNSGSLMCFANTVTPRVNDGFNFSPIANPPDLTGLSGLLFASNYLFVYGSNGLVQWSKPNNPLDFTNPSTRQITISSDKVICAKSIRGGINNPAILFWTMSSVVRCINNPIAGTPADTLAFQIDVISKSSSILSSRCVVEYDGLFFWPGNNRFFHYNGIVQELPNVMSLNYFFNNIDMSYRQNVFGIKNTQYGEIWWFYPEKLGTPGRLDVPQGKVSRALIYNVRENHWNDTAISRSCGVYSDYFGFMATYGPPLVNPQVTTYPYVFRHEYETYNPLPGAINESYVLPPRGVYQNDPISSDFTTPTISWASFNAMKQLTGVNRWLYLITIEPDFTLLPTVAQGRTDMTVIINTKQYAQDFLAQSQPYRILAPLIGGQDSSLAKVDTAWQGRYITLTFRTTVNFEMGQVILQLGIGDGQ